MLNYLISEVIDTRELALRRSRAEDALLESGRAALGVEGRKGEAASALLEAAKVRITVQKRKQEAKEALTQLGEKRVNEEEKRLQVEEKIPEKENHSNNVAAEEDVISLAVVQREKESADTLKMEIESTGKKRSLDKPGVRECAISHKNVSKPKAGGPEDVEKEMTKWGNVNLEEPGVAKKVGRGEGKGAEENVGRGKNQVEDVKMAQADDQEISKGEGSHTDEQEDVEESENEDYEDEWDDDWQEDEGQGSGKEGKAIPQQCNDENILKAGGLRYIVCYYLKSLPSLPRSPYMPNRLE